MIWHFEGGPWDGKTMPALDWDCLEGDLAPQRQIVQPFSGDACVYELVEVALETATYRPAENLEPSR